MELEQQRGISITSTVLQFPYRDCVVNLLDTPGHRDFSEDTYRVLTAADAAVMVLDAAKGIEPQTLKLFEVCRERGLPLLTFINKWDRPGLRPLELLDEIEAHIGDACPRRSPGRSGSPATSAAWSIAAPATSSASPGPPAVPTEAPEELVERRPRRGGRGRRVDGRASTSWTLLEGTEHRHRARSSPARRRRCSSAPR